MPDDFRVRGEGIRVQTADSRTLDKRLRAADRPGQHLWIVTAGWQVLDPERPTETMLDAENLLLMVGPGCYKCEREYSRSVAKRPCTGTLELQP